MRSAFAPSHQAVNDPSRQGAFTQVLFDAPRGCPHDCAHVIQGGQLAAPQRGARPQRVRILTWGMARAKAGVSSSATPDRQLPGWGKAEAPAPQKASNGQAPASNAQPKGSGFTRPGSWPGHHVAAHPASAAGFAPCTGPSNMVITQREEFRDCWRVAPGQRQDLQKKCRTRKNFLKGQKLP